MDIYLYNIEIQYEGLDLVTKQLFVVYHIMLYLSQLAWAGVYIILKYMYIQFIIYSHIYLLNCQIVKVNIKRKIISSKTRYSWGNWKTSIAEGQTIHWPKDTKEVTRNP